MNQLNHVSDDDERDHLKTHLMRHRLMHLMRRRMMRHRLMHLMRRRMMRSRHVSHTMQNERGLRERPVIRLSCHEPDAIRVNHHLNRVIHKNHLSYHVTRRKVRLETNRTKQSRQPKRLH